MDGMGMGKNVTKNVMMEMVFSSEHNFVIYFDSWTVDNESKYAGAIILIFLASMGLELLQFLLKIVLVFQKRASQTTQNVILFNLGYICLYFLWVSLAYLLMLAVMTYSTGVFCAIITGITFGHFLLKIIEPTTPLANESLSQELVVKNPCC
ncbi:unnamed protein product [Blepharisma stoltei]|uniref:Copper transport protein n=1 Tax=Blepharisma stoltei TaxID=1481888 RepID=A0AAU9IXE5_9CILI|nr:unnamed protein product [Blepharisma stoltei]